MRILLLLSVWSINYKICLRAMLLFPNGDCFFNFIIIFTEPLREDLTAKGPFMIADKEAFIRFFERDIYKKGACASFFSFAFS